MKRYKRRKQGDAIWRGLERLLVYHIIVLPTLAIVGVGCFIPNAAAGLIGVVICLTSIYGVLGFSLTQLIYVIPLCLHYRKRKYFRCLKGVIIGALLTAFVNGWCLLLYLN